MPLEEQCESQKVNSCRPLCQFDASHGINYSVSVFKLN